MKPIASLAAVPLLAITACVPRPAPAPPIQNRPAPVPTPAPPPQAPVVANWMDAPATSGDWRYTGAYAGGVAQFGDAGTEPRFTMRCDPNGRSVVLSRAGRASGTARMTIRTETQTRTLAANATTDGLPAVESRLAANDRLLDAMALSKGRFAVEVPGTPTLYLPSWAEVTRVIEDCR